MVVLDPPPVAVVVRRAAMAVQRVMVLLARGAQPPRAEVQAELVVYSERLEPPARLRAEAEEARRSGSFPEPPLAAMAPQAGSWCHTTPLVPA